MVVIPKLCVELGIDTMQSDNENFRLESRKKCITKQQRNIGFEDVICAIQSGYEIDIYEHPNQERYPGQKISVVLVNNYVYLVPFVENTEEIFLKTIIPSRKANKQYAGSFHD